MNPRKSQRLFYSMMIIAMGAMLLIGTGTAYATSTPQARSSKCAWQIVPSQNPGNFSNLLTGVAAISTTNVWAVGNYQSNGIVQTLTENWNGSAWQVVSSPNPSTEAQLNAVSVIPGTNQLWAVGQYFSTYWHTLILKWNGSKWHRIASPNAVQNTNALTGVSATSGNDAWAVGSAYDGSTTTTLIEHWNGKKWSIIPGANPGPSFNNLVAVAAVSPTNAWAVGNYQNDSGEPALTEQWNGTSWSVVDNPSPGDGAVLNAVTPIPGTNQFWAAGYYFPHQSSVHTSLIEQWNGTSWSVVPSPNPGAGFNDLFGVTALSSKNAWVVGQYSPGEVPIIALTEHWNGKIWKQVTAPSPDPGDTLYSVTSIPNTPKKLWAAGGSSSQINNTLTEKYC